MKNKCYKFNVKKMVLKECYKNWTKFYLSNKYNLLKSNKIIKKAYRSFYFYKNISVSYYRRSCVLSTKCNSVFRFFKMSRYLCRVYASNGLFTGLIKASF